MFKEDVPEEVRIVIMMMLAMLIMSLSDNDKDWNTIKYVFILFIIFLALLPLVVYNSKNCLLWHIYNYCTKIILIFYHCLNTYILTFFITLGGNWSVVVNLIKDVYRSGNKAFWGTACYMN